MIFLVFHWCYQIRLLIIILENMKFFEHNILIILCSNFKIVFSCDGSCVELVALAPLLVTNSKRATSAHVQKWFLFRSKFALNRGARAATISEITF